MAASTSLYRALVQLYPRQFRHDYGDDLVLHFEDLVRRDGVRRTWCRATVDLLVTVPRYRMETIMDTRRSNTAVHLLAAVLAIAGLLGYFAGFAPALILVVAAIGVALAERGRLASSLRASTRSGRRRFLVASGVLVVASLATVYVGFADLDGDVSWSPSRILFYNVIFFTLLVAAVVCGVIGLRAPLSSRQSEVRSATP